MPLHLIHHLEDLLCLSEVLGSLLSQGLVVGNGVGAAAQLPLLPLRSLDLSDVDVLRLDLRMLMLTLILHPVIVLLGEAGLVHRRLDDG